MNTEDKDLQGSPENDPSVIEAELVTEQDSDLLAEIEASNESFPGHILAGDVEQPGNQMSWLLYVLLPSIFLITSLLGGMRIAADTGEFVFIRPALICLVFASMLVVLFLRTGLIEIGGWFSESIPTLQNAANSAVLVSLFAASVQIFNSLIPEQGLAFWVVSFCFLWMLGVSFFSVADPGRLVRSVAAMFVIAFLTKYFLLLNLTPDSGGGWLQRLWNDPTKEAITYLLDLPRFAASTGYIQFFAAGLFLLGLFLLPSRTRS